MQQLQNETVQNLCKTARNMEYGKKTQTFSGKFVINGNAKLFQRKQQVSCHSHSLNILNYTSHFRNLTFTKPYIRSARSLNLTSS